MKVPLIITLLMHLFAGSVHAQPMLRAGAYAMNIDPEKFPVPAVGLMTPREATKVHDPLHARCLVIDNGETVIAFAIVDSCMVPREIWDDAKKRVTETVGIPASRILGSATHTHSAVCVTPGFQTDPDKDYQELLKERIALGIIEAYRRLEPARIGWSLGNNAVHVNNRRWFMRDGYSFIDPLGQGTDQVQMNPPAGGTSLAKPAGPTDPEVPIISVQSLEGRPIAFLANYSLHYVGGVPAEYLSADYFGAFARHIGDLLGADADFVGIMTNGTSADINNTNFFEPRNRKEPFEQIERVAEDIALAAKLAHDRIVYQDWVPIQMEERQISLGVRKPTDSELRRAKMTLAGAGEEPYTDRALIYTRESVFLADYPDEVMVKLQALRIGDLGIVATPTETFVETGLDIKKASPFKPTFVIELANGYNGYLPTIEQHQLGGYETWRARSSYLAVSAEPKVRRQLLEMLNQVAE